MSALTHAQDSYQESFARFQEGAGGSGQEWLRSIRRSAMARFSELGFPTTHEEDWRFTNVAPIAETSFRLDQDGAVKPTRRELERFGFSDLEGVRLVFVNGRFEPGLSRLQPLPEGVKIGSLAHELMTDSGTLEQHLGRYADYQHDAFSALNTAFMEDGAFVHIPRRTVLSEPIYLLYVSAPTADPAITHPRNLIVAGEESQATIVEDYVSLSGDVHFSNVVTEVVAGENSAVRHYRIERESAQAFHVSTLRVQQGRSSNVSSHSLLLGGALVRNNVHPVLAGDGADCLINGLFMGTGEQHLDNYMKVEHVGPHCTSRQFYNGILDGRSRGVFHGRIIVHKDAQKTNSRQVNRNLLLSESAIVDSKPTLEIHANDVKCNHGSTIGQLDEEAIFYLRARGIDEEEARSFLIYAFASEVIERLPFEPIREWVRRALFEQMPGRLPERREGTR